MISLYRPVLDGLGLTHPQYLVMLALWERDPRTVREISDALFLDPATLSPLLKRLKAQGLLTRARSAADERSLAVTLTNEGRALRAQAEAVPARIVELLGVPAAHLERLRDDLTTVLEASRLAPSRRFGQPSPVGGRMVRTTRRQAYRGQEYAPRLRFTQRRRSRWSAR